MTLEFLALLGAPYIYEISSLSVDVKLRPLPFIQSPCSVILLVLDAYTLITSNVELLG